MKKIQKAGSIVRGLAAGLAVMACISVAKATPFASCITNNAGTISYYLNEGGGTVSVVFDGGAVSNNLGVLAAGPQSFSLAGHTTYQIYVQKTGTGSPSLINQYIFSGNQRGVVANGNVTSPYFGYIYQADGGNGIILYNSDLSGNGVSPTVLTGGVSWAGGSYGPDKIAVQTNDILAVSDYSLNNSTVWQMSPNLSTATQILSGIGLQANHGAEESQPVITGTLAQGNLVLQVVDGEVPNTAYNSILTYNIGSGPLPWGNAPDVVGPEINPNLVSYGGSTFNFYGSLIIGPNGQVYTCNERANFSNPNLGVYPSSPGVSTPLLYDSRYNSDTADYFQTAIAGHSLSLPDDCAVSPDFKYVATIHLDNHMTIASLDSSGIPINSSIYTIAPTSFTGNGRGIAFDAADNVLTSSSGEADIQEWSLGLTATCITSGNASGLTGFQVVLPASTVSVTATTNNAVQGGQVGCFNVARTGSLSSPLVVNFTYTGTAASPSVYTATYTGTVTIGAGQSSTNIFITATSGATPLPTETVVLNLATSPNYAIGTPAFDTVYIVNTVTPQLTVGALVPTMYKAYASDYSSFTIVRYGNTNTTVTLSGYTLTGTAVSGVDYTTPGTVTFNPGVVTNVVKISPLSNGVPPVNVANPTYTGNKIVNVALTAGGGYTVAGSAALTIIDNAQPTATVLFSDPLDSTTATADSANWLVTFANKDTSYPTNGNFEVGFGWDLTTDPDGLHGTVSSPPSGATTALRLTVNKAGTTGNAGATAGVNVYPVDPVAHTPLVFSGSYAVRFNMALVRSENTSYATEGALFGIDHSGLDTNWFTSDGVTSGGPWPSDGYWMWVDSDAGGTTDGDFVGFQGIPAAAPGGDTGWEFIPGAAFGALFDTVNFTNVFKDNPGPFNTGFLGSPADLSSLSTSSPATPWVDVEIKQINVGTQASPTNVITYSINKSTILAYTSTNVYTSGDLMLGYNDPFASIGEEDGAAFFSNLRVVQIGPIKITGTAVTGGNVVINFTTSDGDDSTASFTVLGSALAGTAVHVDTTVSGVTFLQLGPGAFQATFPEPAVAAAFYRIKHN